MEQGSAQVVELGACRPVRKERRRRVVWVVEVRDPESIGDDLDEAEVLPQSRVRRSAPGTGARLLHRQDQSGGRLVVLQVRGVQQDDRPVPVQVREGRIHADAVAEGEDPVAGHPVRGDSVVVHLLGLLAGIAGPEPDREVCVDRVRVQVVVGIHDLRVNREAEMFVHRINPGRVGMPSAHFSTNTGGRAPEDALIADLHSTVLFVRSTTVIVIASVDRREKLLYAHRSPASQTLSLPSTSPLAGERAPLYGWSNTTSGTGGLVPRCDVTYTRVGPGCRRSPPRCRTVILTPTSAFPTMTGFIVDSMSKRDCAVGVGMFVTQMMIVENRTTVIARIRIVPMTSDTPDSSSRRITFISC